MRTPYLYECIDLNIDSTNEAFEDVLDWLKELNMKDSAEEMEYRFREIVRENNPFMPWNTEKVFSSPTVKMIYLIYEEAKRRIKEKFHDAVITYELHETGSKFKVDDETYDKAYAERYAGEEEDE